MVASRVVRTSSGRGSLGRRGDAGASPARRAATAIRRDRRTGGGQPAQRAVVVGRHGVIVALRRPAPRSRVRCGGRWRPRPRPAGRRCRSRRGSGRCATRRPPARRPMRPRRRPQPRHRRSRRRRSPARRAGPRWPARRPRCRRRWPALVPSGTGARIVPAGPDHVVGPGPRGVGRAGLAGHRRAGEHEAQGQSGQEEQRAGDPGAAGDHGWHRTSPRVMMSRGSPRRVCGSLAAVYRPVRGSRRRRRRGCRRRSGPSPGPGRAARGRMRLAHLGQASAGTSHCTSNSMPSGSWA